MQIEFDPGISRDKGGLEKVMSLMQTHFDLGGTEINMNVIDADRVREAHKDPHSFLRSYVTHARFLRKCYRMYGPEAVGWPGTVKLMARSHLKSGVYRLATYLGVQEAVIGRRNGRPLTEAERRAAQEGLDAVRRAAVPGLDCETGRRGIVADEGRDRH